MNGPVLRVAVVGHTNRGNFGHAMDTAFSRVPGTRIVAVADPDETEIPRRAFSVCYMDAATQTTSGETYSVLFGKGALRL